MSESHNGSSEQDQTTLGSVQIMCMVPDILTIASFHDHVKRCRGVGTSKSWPVNLPFTMSAYGRHDDNA